MTPNHFPQPDRRRWVCLAAIALCAAPPARALSNEEAAQLGTRMTEVGAIREGNAEGTIPPYAGGLSRPPAGYAPLMGERGGAPYIDPYAAEKPLFSIDAKNLDRHADKLDEGSRTLLQRYPESYRIDVYPSHRSAALPRYALDNTVKNALKPRLAGDGTGIENAHAQVPFPIPKSGLEALWNVQLHYVQPWDMGSDLTWLIDTAGRRSLLTDARLTRHNPYWDANDEKVDDYTLFIIDHQMPASRAGTKELMHVPLRMDLANYTAWQYIPGQRRVRMAPDLQYDTVVASRGGLMFYDEANGLWGKLDRFDYRLVGRREMYVPYNAYRFIASPVEAATMASHHDPAVLRFELHRVWVVEGTLKKGQRHAESRKVWYIDEDSWNIAVYNAFDQAGRPFRLMLNALFTAYETPAVRSEPSLVYDLASGGYSFTGGFAAPKSGFTSMPVPANPDTYFSPDALAGRGIR